MPFKKNRHTNVLLFFAFVTLFGLAFMRVHMRVQATIIGYQLGQLKTQEAELLERRSQLQMELAKLTTREQLQKATSSAAPPDGTDKHTAVRR